MRVLITGAGGFTGRYLAQELAGAGHEVVGMLSDVAGEHAPPGSQSAVRCDLLDAEAVAQMVQDVQPELVAHLAGIAFVAHGDAQGIYQVNLIGTRHLLEGLAALPRPPRMTLLASSANVYGNTERDPLDEATPPAPANDYGVSKLAMEYMARLYAERLPIVITRPFNYTGVGQSDRFLLPKMVNAVRQRAPQIELGNLDVARDFSDVRTVVRDYRRLLESPAAAGGTFNVCSGTAHSLREVLDTVQALAGHRLDVRVNPAFVRGNEIRVLRGSRQQLDALIGASPGIALEDTLRWMLEDGP